MPADVLGKAHFNGSEYAWRIEDIPGVIEAARRAGLLNIGGQLQFRVPPIDTICECYWVEVNVWDRAPETLAWVDRVERAATAAAADFRTLLT